MRPVDAGRHGRSGSISSSNQHAHAVKHESHDRVGCAPSARRRLISASRARNGLRDDAVKSHTGKQECESAKEAREKSEVFAHLKGGEAVATLGIGCSGLPRHARLYSAFVP